MALDGSNTFPYEIDLSELEALGAQLDTALGFAPDADGPNDLGSLEDILASTTATPDAPRSEPAPKPASAPSSVGSRPSPSVVGGGSAEVQSPIQRAKFAPLVEEPVVPASSSNIDLLMDVSLKVSVELGRATLNVREALNLSPGNVVELDKLAGDPVDVLVNGRLIARGEVVVVEDQFGVRVTQIVSARQRVEAMR